MDLGVRDKLYLIVGGSAGMGFEAARILAAEGARVAIVGRNRARLETAASAIAAASGAAVTRYVADASADDGSFEEEIASIVASEGAPRGLLVTTGSVDPKGDLLTLEDREWQALFQDVLMGHVRAARAVIPGMVAAGGGQIVTTAAWSVRSAKTYLVGYSSLKTAIVTFTKSLAKAYGAQGIRANCVCPGAFATDSVSSLIDEVATREGLSRDDAARHVVTQIFRMPVAMERPGSPHEAGELMTFLLSERASYLNGAVINIDGGTDF